MYIVLYEQTLLYSVLLLVETIQYQKNSKYNHYLPTNLIEEKYPYISLNN